MAKRITKSTTAPVALKSILPKGMTDKAARRKLRAAAPSFHGKRERWTFTPAQAKQAREILGA
jgi:hypothetical protein